MTTSKTCVLVETFSTGLGFEVVKAALQRNYRVIFLCRDQARYGEALRAPSLAAMSLIETNTYDFATLRNVLTELRDTIGIDILLGLQDDNIELVAKVAMELDLYFSSPEAVETLVCKDRFREIMKKLNLPNAIYASLAVNDLKLDPKKAIEASGLRYPVVLKPSRGSGSNHVHLIESHDELHTCLEQLSDVEDVLLEEYLLGPMFSLETLTKDNQTQVLAVTSRRISRPPYFQELTCGMPVEIPCLNAIQTQVDTLLTHLNYDVAYSAESDR